MALKTLISCTPREFFSQTVKIRKSVEKWLSLTDILNIRKNQPKFIPIPEGENEENKKIIIAENEKLKIKQAEKNLLEMFDACFERHPNESLEVLALICFVDPEKVDDHSMSEYIEALREMLMDKTVLSFFTSLAQLGQTDTSRGASK